VLEAGGAICDPAGACVCVYVLRVCACGVCWDVAAGALIVLEAGGAISDPAGACVCVYVLRVCGGGCWNVAAGALIVLEAGGAICDPAGACVCLCVCLCAACVFVWGLMGRSSRGADSAGSRGRNL